MMLAEVIVIQCLYIHAWHFMASIDDRIVGNILSLLTGFYITAVNVARVLAGEPETNVISCLVMSRTAKEMTYIQRIFFRL